jgi:hypothetical protein
MKKFVVSFSLLLCSVTSAEVALVKKMGASAKYENCSVYEKYGVIELYSGSKSKFTQRSEILTPIDLNMSEDIAIEGAGRPFYRWSNMSMNYFVRSSSGDLKRYYAHGFENIVNNTPEAKYLIDITDKYCDKVIRDFDFLGNFNLNLKIGDRLFVDELIVDRKFAGHFQTSVQGKYIVPGSFESKLSKINYDGKSFSFVIHVVEGEDDYKAIFEGEIINNKLNGKAFVLPDRNLLGEFTGERK